MKASVPMAVGSAVVQRNLQTDEASQKKILLSIYLGDVVGVKQLIEADWPVLMGWDG